MCPSVLLSSPLSHMLLSVEEKYVNMKLFELCSMYDVVKLDLVVLFTGSCDKILTLFISRAV